MNSGMKKWMIVFPILFAASALGQTVFSGRIKSPGGHAVAYANVLLRSDTTEKILSYCFSDSSGFFLLKAPDAANCSIYFSAIGYKSRKLRLPAWDHAADRQLHLVVLEPETQVLNEVVVNATPPIRIKQDTIVADAGAFAKGDERVLEDLLKKIPGIQVLEDGTVKVGNKEIEKIMIEGDDFFETSYRLLTRNMPPAPVSKIEILQHYSDNRLLKGVVKSNKVALNLKMKPGIVHQWFGNTDAGLDCIRGKQYDARMNLIKLGKKFRHYWLGSMNNTGEVQSTEVNEPDSKAEEDTNEDFSDVTPRAVKLISISAAALPGQKRAGDQTSGLYTLNTIWRPFNKIRIKTGLQLSQELNRFNSTTIDSAGINQISFVNVEVLSLRRQGLNGTGKISITCDLSEQSILEYELKLGMGNATNQNHLLLNQQAIRDTLKTEMATNAQLLRFSSKLSPKTVLQITARYLMDEAPQYYQVDQFNYQPLFPNAIDANHTYQFAGHSLRLFSVQSKLSFRPSVPSFFELLAGMISQHDRLHTEFAIADQSLVTDRPAGFQNQLGYNTQDLFFKIRYRYQMGKNISLIQQLSVHAVHYSYSDANKTDQRDLLLMNPALGMEWKLSEKNLLLLNCSLNKRNSRVSEVYGNYLLNGYRLFSRGSGSVDQPEAAVMSASFTHGNWADRFFANVILLYNKDFTAYGTQAIVTQLYTQQETISVNQNRAATLTANLDYFLPVIAANIKLSQNAIYSRSTNRINGSVPRNVQHIYLNSGLEIRSAWKGWLNIHAGANLGHHQVTASYGSRYTDYMSFIDLHFRFGGGVQLNLKTECFSWGGTSRQNGNYYFCDLDLSYSLLKNRLDCTIAGRNLLNTDRFRSYTISDIGFTSLTYRLLSRYLLLKLALRL